MRNQNKHVYLMVVCLKILQFHISNLTLKPLTHCVNEEYCGCHGNQAIAIAHKRRHNFEKKVILNISFHFSSPEPKAHW